MAYLLAPRGSVIAKPRSHGVGRGPVCRFPACILFLAITVVLVLTPSVTQAQASVPAEYRDKASFLTTFPTFIDWPDNAFSAPEAPFVICVVGDFRFGTALAESARHSPPLRRRIEIRWVRQDLQLRNCHILFVSSSEANRYVKVLQLVRGAATLTVGETPGFLDLGGMLSFALQEDSLQFEVNLAAANKAHLRFSSKLLALARRVLGSPDSSNGYITAQKTNRRAGDN